MVDQVLGTIHLTGGFEEVLDTDLMIGRDPGQQPLLPSQRGVVHGVGDRIVSRRHVELRLDGSQVYVVSWGSKTLLRRRSGELSELVRGAPVLFGPGDTLHYGEGLSLRYAPDRAVVGEAQISDSDVEESAGSKQNEIREPLEPIAENPMALPTASEASHKLGKKYLGKIAVGSRFAIIAFVVASVAAGSAIWFWAQWDSESAPLSRPTLNATGGDRTITATWSADDNGSPITSWEIDGGNPTEGPGRTATSHTWNDVAPGDYTITAQACNNAGCGPTARTTVTVIDVPSRPTLNATGGDRTITATWSADDNGSPITSWEINDGNLQGSPSPTATSHTWNNVAPGDYTIEVRACNAAGCGPTARTTVTVIDVPSRPTLNATGGDRTITATWSADDNGSPITSWEINDGNLQGSPSPTATSHTWNDVAPGDYTITAQACNNAGCGPTARTTVTVIDVPSRPTLNATGGDRTITATWSADDNGSPITSWEINDGNLQGSPSPTATSHTWNNVAPGDYTIEVRACNAAGCGPTAQTTATVTALSVPPSQPALRVLDRVERIQMSWSADDNGSPITRWEINDGNLQGSPSPTATSHTWNNVAPGTYTITARACNNAGCGPTALTTVTVTDTGANTESYSSS